MYYQCRLSQVSQRRTTWTVVWLEDRNAHKGALVKLDGEPELWHVAEAYRGFGLPEEALKGKQRRDRNSLPSLGKA